MLGTPGQFRPVPSIHLNITCHGGLVVGHAVAWELVRTFFTARFSPAERHRGICQRRRNSKCRMHSYE